MNIHWNSCFLCLNDLNLKLPSTTGTARGRKRKCDPSPNVITLMKYLLQTDNNKYDKLLKGILEASKCTQDYTEKTASLSQSSTFPIHFCDECISSIKRVSELHKQLETLQMKLVDSLKDMREKIIFNSKAHGSNEATKISLQMFEAFLVTLAENQPGHNESSQVDRKRLDLLYSFQDAIFEIGRDTPPLVPFVFLEPISRFKPQPASADYKDESPVEADPDRPPPFLKIEHIETQSTEEEFEESFSPPGFDNNQDMLPPFISHHIKEERSTRMLRSTTLRKVKVEVKVTNEPKQSVAKTTRIRRHLQKKKRGAAGRQKVPLRKHLSAKGKKFKYKCKICSFIEERGGRFEQHLRDHETADKIHPCSFCDKKFSGKQLYEYHMGLHGGWRGSKSRVACDFNGCSERVSRAELADHISNSHGIKAFLCQCCSFSSATREKYIFHIRIHSQNNLICDVCSSTFKKREKLISHMFEEHGVGKELRCEEDGCEETFLDPIRLRVHKLTHRNSKMTTYFCKECNQHFSGKNAYIRHMEVHSKLERSYNCDLCPELFISRFALEQHKLKDHDAPKLICTYCQKQFPDYRKLLRHITKNHQGARYPCTYCDMTFGTTHSWRRHQYIHSAGRTYVCEECGKLFQTQSALTIHLKIHDKKIHKCSYCPKAFTKFVYLKEHIYTHTGEKPWVCDHCGKAFTQQGSLQIHKRKVHDMDIRANKRGKVSENKDAIAINSAKVEEDM